MPTSTSTTYFHCIIPGWHKAFSLTWACRSSSALMESLINPLQDKIEDWKKTANQLDKDHAKGRFSCQNSNMRCCYIEILQFQFVNKIPVKKMGLKRSEGTATSTSKC